MGILNSILGSFIKTEEETSMRGKVGRNDPCWCGSGKKYKKCHLLEDEKNPGKNYHLNCGTTS